jgi:hypothetical protein
VDDWDARVVLRYGVTSCWIGGLARQGFCILAVDGKGAFLVEI